MNSPGLQATEVLLDGGMGVHLPVHGRSDEDGAGAGEVEIGQEVVGESVGELGDGVSGGWGHHEQIGLSARGHMTDPLLIIEGEEVG